MENQALNKLALDLINQQSTMTLATAQNDTAWAAPVYYVFYKSAFFFFSDPKSRHIVEALASGQTSAAIYPHADTWQGIRGIQMSGRIRQIGAGLTAVQAIGAYVKKFPFSEDFFESGQPLDLGNFIKRFKVRLYSLEPHIMYYLDNQIKFGFREEITL